MEPTKTIIENWPTAPWYKDYIPIFIALVALGTSLLSLYWTRVESIKSSRPYIWALNYTVNGISVPHRVFFVVKNSPAKIIKMDVKIFHGSNQLLSYPEKDFVRFPIENSEWIFSISKDKFEQMMNRTEEEKQKIRRIISIDYSSLDGGKEYHYILEQKFIPNDNQWMNIIEKSN